ncbi:MAG TPA: SIS domain-containing protein [Candidatus Dormibacteraeota bacterium]|nr:SIS domain-containing protein [Candidatus Dormibacteraeota bacterium]
MPGRARGDPGAPLPPAPDPWAGSEMPERRTAPPFHMTEMIEAEPALAVRILERLASPSGPAAALAAAIRAASTRGLPIVVTGCGTSEHGALGTVEILRAALRTAGLPWQLGRGGTPVAAQAFEAWLEDGLGGEGGVVIGVSHEGGTWATNGALERAKASGAMVALITVSARSPGAHLADVTLTTEEQDQSWCHTVGYVSPLLAAAAVAAHITREPLDPGVVQDLMAAGLAPAAVAATEAMADALANVDRLIVIGSGVDRPAARELVLKVEEGAHLPAAMRDLETLLHGHLAGMDTRTGVVLILADPSRADERAARAAGVLRAVRELGGPAGAILGPPSDSAIGAELAPAGRLLVPAAPGVPPVVAAVLGTAVPLQLLTERLARARGVDPDPIRRDDPTYLQAADAAG